MKPSSTKLGLMIQKYLLENRLTIDDLAAEMGINPDSLSNLIHGRRKFKDHTLECLAETEIFKQGGFDYHRLKAYRAIDEYQPQELFLALTESIKDASIEDMPKEFIRDFNQHLHWGGFPKNAVLYKSALESLLESLIERSPSS